MLILATIALAIFLAQPIYAPVGGSETSINNAGVPTIDAVYVNGKIHTPRIVPEIILFPTDGSTTTLKVDFTYVQGDDYATLEFWSLKDDEIEKVSGPDFKKNNREYQFLIKQPYEEEEIKLDPKVITDQINEATEQGNPDAKLGDTDYGVGGAQHTKKFAWRGLTLEDYYNFTSQESDRKYYLLVETNSRQYIEDDKFTIPWNDSDPREIRLEKSDGEELSAVETWDIFDSEELTVVNNCKTVPECLAILDLSFIQQVFKKKN